MTSPSAEHFAASRGTFIETLALALRLDRADACEAGLVIRRVEAREAAFEPWNVEVELGTGDRDPAALARELLESAATLTVADRHCEKTFGGIVTRAAARPANRAGGDALHLTIEPRLALLRHRSDWRRFIDITLADAVAQIVCPLGLRHGADYQIASGQQRVDCRTQAGESDWTFLHGLLAVFGCAIAFNTCDRDPQEPPVTIGPVGDLGRAIDLDARDASIVYEVAPTAISKVPEPGGRATSQHATGGSAPLREQAARLSMNCPRFAARQFDEFSGEDAGSGGETWRVLRTTLSCRRGAGDTLASTFHVEAAPVGDAAAPVAPRPAVAGVHGATVVGPRSGEPHVDDQGRIQLRFDWEEDQSHAQRIPWVPVAQACAGDGWGTRGWPRAGERVLVAFEHGDIERPTVLGRIYASDRLPELPAAMELGGARLGEVSGVQSRVIGAGGDRGHLLLMSDRPGEELVALRAARRLVEHVEGSRCRRVDADDEATAGGEVLRRSDRRILLEAGSAELTLDASGSVRVAARELELTASGSTIRLDAGGVTINGRTIRLN